MQLNAQFCVLSSLSFLAIIKNPKISLSWKFISSSEKKIVSSLRPQHCTVVRDSSSSNTQLHFSQGRLLSSVQMVVGGVAMTPTFQVAEWRRGRGRVHLFSMLPGSWSAVLWLSTLRPYLVAGRPTEYKCSLLVIWHCAQVNIRSVTTEE